MNVQRSRDDRLPFVDQVLAVLLAIFPFVPVALNVTTYRYLRLDYGVTSRIQLVSLAIFLALAVAGWMRGFPRWSYPYIVTIAALLFAIIVGHDSDMTLREDLTWKLTILGPFVLLFGAAWLFLRKKYPFRRLFQNVRSDWTLFAFCIYSLLILVIQGIFTSMRSVYGAPYLYVSTLLGMTGAGLYVLLASKSERIAALVGCLTLAWLVMGTGSATYWDDRYEYWMSAPGDGRQLAVQYAIGWGAMLFMMLLPAMISKIKR